MSLSTCIPVLTALVFAACTAPLERLQPVDPTAAASLVVIRGSAGGRDPLVVTLDGQAIAALPGGCYTQLSIQPGPHRLGIGCMAGWGLAWTEHHQLVIADPRTTYSFLVTPAPGCARIESLSADAAQDWLARTAYRPMDGGFQ